MESETMTVKDERKVTRYLGGGVYMEMDDGCGFWLTTENGCINPSRIFLEWGVYKALLHWVDHARAKMVGEDGK